VSIVDLEERREARRREAWERWVAWSDRELAEIRRAVAAIEPLVNQLIARSKFRRRAPRCESPGCWNSFTSCERVRGPEPAIVRLCAAHQQAVRCGRMRLSTEGPDILVWELYDRPGAPPRLRLKQRRGAPRRRSRW